MISLSAGVGPNIFSEFGILSKIWTPKKNYKTWNSWWPRHNVQLIWIVLAWPFSDFQACFHVSFLLGRFHATLYKAAGNQNKSVIRLIARAAAILHKSFFNAPSRMKDCPLHSTHGKSQVSIFSNLNALNFVSSALYFSPPFDEH